MNIRFIVGSLFLAVCFLPGFGSDLAAGRPLSYMEKEMYKTKDMGELKKLYRSLKTDFDCRYFFLALPEYAEKRQIARVPWWLRRAVIRGLDSKDPLVVCYAASAIAALKINCPAKLLSVYNKVHTTFGSHEDMVKTAIIGALGRDNRVRSDTLKRMETSNRQPAMPGRHGSVILVVIDSAAFLAVHEDLTQYLDDIAKRDHKKAKLIVWQTVPNTNYRQCDSLWRALQNEYFASKDSGDWVEGAVMIGNIPVPLTHHGDQWLPLDQVYMDVVDTRQDHPRRYIACPFSEDVEDGNCFWWRNNYNGDRKFDMWVTRVNAQYLNGGIRAGVDFFDENAIYKNYLSKVHARMTKPPTVPSRGFVMGGSSQYFSSYPLHNVLGRTMMKLNLPWIAEFTGGENSAFNWMSQLLAGPRGCVTCGGFNGKLFQNERGRRYCRYDTLNTVYVRGDTVPTSRKVDPSDSLGWEWAGLYNYSCPEFIQFAGEGSGRTLGGYFNFGTLGPCWSSGNYQDDSINPDPYNRRFGWKEKYVVWRWKVTSKGAYNVYAYFATDSKNCNYVEYYMQYDSLDARGAPVRILNGMDDMRYRFGIDQRSYESRLSSNPASPDYNWHQIFSNELTLDSNRMAAVYSPANRGNHPLVLGGLIRGRQIVGGIRFIRVDGKVDQTVSDTQPATFPNSENHPDEIFATDGCFTSDAVDRGYEDMGDESGGGGFSKTQFFLILAGQINNFIHYNPEYVTPGDTNIWKNRSSVSKCLGNLYALGHDGLICMGAVTSDYLGDSYDPFVSSLAEGKDFGQAFLDQQNANPFGMIYCLLGTGSLKSRPYVFQPREKLKEK